ncbi:type VI secretion system membrane subunit TssM [Paracoccus sp. SSJ]|uniref:type VI secretion system membrane subunit TssM n=1 Tax=Paracoccus sp. SSJ TaxID=3050636 RepID=UPI002549DA0B|nr:type VI secretion system membrane subunit TssM [Paracoccus sp. SSJ]MDK8874864.1 type VI secretion system membrane subunit TssM [Paracoccus sp. SSJ]
MRILKAIFRFFLSRGFWTFVGLALLAAAIWFYGPLVSVGEAAPLESAEVRALCLGAILVLWLLILLVGQIRAARRNRMFVTELAAPPPLPDAPDAAAEIGGKFQEILATLARSRLGKRRFLREMPWYVIIGPPGTGKTTALRQSGLNFPIALNDDLKGVGGTRNCDWFFTENAVLVDTAGRYTDQSSEPERDAAEWAGFLDLLKRHRGRRALNGVIVALSLDELLGPEDALRRHAREIRKRLTEIAERLEMQLPVYLMLTKADRLPGFETFFGALTSAERAQVWGATLPVDALPEPEAITREFRSLAAVLEGRLDARLAEDADLPQRAAIFRFPAEFERLEAPLRLLIDTAFGESRYEQTPWLRGFYLSSATQEGSPLDRMLAGMAAGFGLAPAPVPHRAMGERRSFFLHDLLAGVIFGEAGLGLFDPRAEERRTWIWRGSAVAAALLVLLAGLGFLFNTMRQSGAVADQQRLLADLAGRLANAASRQAPTEPLDLPVALDAMTEIEAARTPVPGGPLALIGPSAAAEIEGAARLARERGLRNLLEPRMVAFLEATMWRQIRDPDFLLGALKAYQMLTGLGPYDRAWLAEWWQEVLPAFAAETPFPTEAARLWQLAALDRLGGDESRIEADPQLVEAALQAICTVPLSLRTYRALMSEPEIATLPDWIPAGKAGPLAGQVLTRLSGQTLRQGIPGAFTWQGFHGTVLPMLPGMAEAALNDRKVFAGGCAESADASAASLQADMMKLYQDDFINAWEGFLRDVRLAPIPDLATATANLKDLASPDSTLKRLLNAVVAETDLARPPEQGDSPEINPGVLKKVAGKLGLGAAARIGTKVAAAARRPGEPEPPPPGAEIARHFAPLKAIVAEVDGKPPLIADAETALGALSKELLTVQASPDPQAALLSRGGLPQLTGDLRNVAATLPDPVNAWLGAIAGDTISVTREAILAQLNARWRADVLPFCRAATGGRYPFVADSAIDVTVSDFQQLFGPGGRFDGFTNETLAPYVDTSARPWRWRADLGLDARTLAPFEQARAIRDALFPGGAGPVMAFTLEPKDLTPNAARVTLNVDGQSLVYFNAAARPMPMTWPGKDGTNLISLSFTPVDGTGEAISTETGAWAWLRLVRKAGLSPTALPEVFGLRLGIGPYAARFELRAASVENPFDLSMFGAFRCPEAF